MQQGKKNPHNGAADLVMYTATDIANAADIQTIAYAIHAIMFTFALSLALI